MILLSVDKRLERVLRSGYEEDGGKNRSRKSLWGSVDDEVVVEVVFFDAGVVVGVDVVDFAEPRALLLDLGLGGIVVSRAEGWGILLDFFVCDDDGVVVG